MSILHVLQTFLAEPGDSRGLDKPHGKEGGWLIFCDGPILVRVPFVAGIDFRTERYSGMQSLIDREFAREREFTPLQVDLPEPQHCALCDGTGKRFSCGDCDGVGEFEHGNHAYMCKECDGTGFHDDDEAGESSPCPECRGTGHYDMQSVPVGVAEFKRRYLASLITLPGLRISIIGPYDVAAFRFDGGCGLLMPIRKWP